MKKQLSQIIFILTLSILLCITYRCIKQTEDESDNLEPANLVIRDGTIYTVNAARSWAQALAVRQGKLQYVGTDQGVNAYIGPKTQIVNLEGRFVLPGFHDSHVHLVLGGLALSRCDVSGAKSVGEMLELIKSYAETNPDKPWILGGGWAQGCFPEATPKKGLLDYIVPDRPVMLWDRGLHSIWVNSKTLEISGITRETPDPERGRIERDLTTGEPIGTLRETATQLVEQHIPEVTELDRVEAIRQGLKLANSFGIVSLQDAMATPEIFEAFVTADREGVLTSRIRAALYLNPDKDLEEQIEEFLRLREAYQGPRLNAGTTKIFIDGVIDAKTAVLSEPYEGMDKNDSEASGVPIFDPEKLKQIVTRLDKEGFQVHMHAIGDKAIRIGLDAVEQARLMNGFQGTRHHISHLNLIHPEDLERFCKLGVIANFQPFWFKRDDYKDIVLSFVGPKRFQWLFQIRSVMETGAVVAAGSDWNVSSFNPLDAIQVAVTRRHLDDKDGPQFFPEQRLDLASMVACYTIRGAYLNYEEKFSGSIEVGKWADFVVLDKNLFKIPVHEIHKAKVLWTFVEGKEVYRASDWEPVFE